MKRTILLSLCLVLLLPACTLLNMIQPAPTDDITQTLAAARTEAVETAQAEAGARESTTPPTASPSLPPTTTWTPPPTETSVPTATASLTASPSPLPTATLTFTPVPTATKVFTATPVPPVLEILAVERNRAVTLQGKNFTANDTFYVRIGPASVFYVNYAVAGTVSTGAASTFRFTVLLPYGVRNQDRITVRLDNVQGRSAEVTFTNTDSSQVAYDVQTPVLSVPECEVTTSPQASRTFAVREDFDAVWTIKNTSGRAWEMHEVDYEFLGGVAMYKHEKRYDIQQSVLPNESITFVVDMLAPSQAGPHASHWGVVLGKTVLCHLPLKIVVR